MSFNRTLAVIVLTLVCTGAFAATPDRIVLPTNVVPQHYAISIVPDARHLTFTGTVHIDIMIRKPTHDIELNAADLTFKQVLLRGIKPAPTVSFDTTEQTATLHFLPVIQPGHHVLIIDYAGTINRHAAGLFALDYDTAHGQRRALFTQFENSDARRFVPSWDEPGIKATYTLSATVPAHEMPVSNMPIAKRSKLKGGLMRVQFAQTPRMSSYLLFFGLGDFQRISREINGVRVGVVVKRGDTDKAQYALDVASQILPYYENYFGVKYPLPKLDLIAGPGQSQTFGAMENWGAIFYFERDLLIDPTLSTQADHRNVYLVIAHEMAHQWFGDLVTMAWWDDIWLNEGFASWMQIKAMDHFHPEWKPWLDALGAKEAAMNVDSREGTHPIITPIHDVLQANEAFDTITYSKGMSVIRMLESYIGSDAFRDGIRAYIKAHAYGNTVSDDLWDAMDKTTSLPVTEIAHDFTLQAGVPMIRVTKSADGIRLTQDRYAVDDSGKNGGSWRVPVTVASIGGTPIWHGLVSRSDPADIKLPANVVPVVNYGQTSYFRTLYDPALANQLAAQFVALAPADQSGLLNDSLALGEAGYEPMRDFLALTQRVTPDLDTTVLNSVMAKLNSLNAYYDRLPTQAAYQAYARSVLAPVLAKIGWTARPGEDGNVTVMRTYLLMIMGNLNDQDVIAEANKRFAAYLKDRKTLSGDMRQVVLNIVAEHADSATWNELHGLAKAATSNMEKRQLYMLLALAHDPELAKRALDLSLTDEAPATTRPAMLTATSYYFPEMAMDFYVAHMNVYDKLLEPSSRPRFAPWLCYGAPDLGLIAKLNAYADAHIPAQDRGAVIKAEAAIRKTVNIRSKRLPEVDTWIKTSRF